MAEKITSERGFKGVQLLIWISALAVGGILGYLEIPWLNGIFDFIAVIYTRIFKFVAVPTIALAITTTLAVMGAHKNAGMIFRHTIFYTLLTTLVAALLGAGLYALIAPGNLPADVVAGGAGQIPENLGTFSYKEHILSVIPDNILAPVASGNVLSILLVSAAVGLVLAFRGASENTAAVLKILLGLQEILFAVIKAVIWTLPVGIVAFSAQLSAQLSAGVVMESIGKYTAVALAGNIIQFFVILPIFLLCRGINPLRVFRGMLPAVLMALFTKSSTATLPVTVESAEENLQAKPEVARFVLPVCCTINMNGCAAFVLVTSLFLMQNGGVDITVGTMLVWTLIAVVAAVGNAGVPMGCYFLTLSLMAGMGAPVEIMGIILPIYAVIDMIETAVNVWSDSCVCAMVDKSVKKLDC